MIVIDAVYYNLENSNVRRPVPKML